MTHGDIYTKFMIEYDKANITSSYPSLTEYEIATILDKAYLALIAQKYSGNDPRGVAFESDMKAVEDLQPLIDTFTCTGSKTDVNEYTFPTHDKRGIQFIVQVSLDVNNASSSIDGQTHTKQNVAIVSHDIAKRFRATTNNLPWVESPVGCIENGNTVIYVDMDVVNANGSSSSITVKYIKTPKKFAVGPGNLEDDYDFGNTTFELSDRVAEQVINLAIIMSTEIVESSRLSTKTNTRPLEV